MLACEGVNAFYGPIHALKDVTFAVERGTIVAVLGANGAGKTTLMNTISGLVRPRSGAIHLDGRRIDRLAPERIVRLGVTQVPEGRQLFPDLTVAENLRMGAYLRRGAAVRQDLAAVLERFPALKDRTRQLAGTLSGGEQQMLAIGRALMARPRLLLLDEPSLGLSPILVRQLFRTLGELGREGISMVLAEQNAYLSLEVAQMGIVLETGRVALQGPSPELRQTDRVRQLYLGVRSGDVSPQGGGAPGGKGT
ncbi:MAG: ABC transporter ATP-binding protein [Candidatus Bipolaricaulota bacterium]|nr:ABC transporter ATP-binding protein [Candidatus Bipolaricaulota bacterium]